MKATILLLFVSTCLASKSDLRLPTQADLQRHFGEPVLAAINRNQHRNPTELTQAMFLDCDQDKDGELDLNELAKCVSNIIHF